MSEKTIYKTLAPFFDAVDGTEEKALKLGSLSERQPPALLVE